MEKEVTRRAVIVSASAPNSVSLAPGGGGVVIDDLVEDLVDIGFFVTVLTPDDGATPFNGESYCVEPVLRSSGYLWGLMGPFDPGERLEDVAIIDEYAFSADMVIFSDRPIPHPYPCPTALLVQAVAYWEALSSVLHGHYDAIWTPSDYAARVCRYMLGGCCRPTEIQFKVLPPAAHVTAERVSTVSSAGQIRLASPHRAEHIKGHREAIQVAAALTREGLACHLSIPAAGSQIEKDLWRLSEELQVADSVELHSWIVAAEMGTYLQSMNWVLSLGVYPESFGLSVAASVVAGTPVIAQPIGAVPEVMEGNPMVRLHWSDDLEGIISTVQNHPDAQDVELGKRRVVEVSSREGFRMAVRDAVSTFGRTSRVLPGRTPKCSCAAPWLRSREGRIWNDIAADFDDARRLIHSRRQVCPD